MKILVFVKASLLLLLLGCSSIKSNSESLVIYDPEQEKTVVIQGDCTTQESPCSTFKIALSLMGFDVGILENSSEPAWNYKKEYDAKFDLWKQSHTPKTWIQNSCVWYSRVLVSRLSGEKFQTYVKNFAYGNQDVSGNPAWLCSSLKISPLEQVAFIKKLLQGALPVSKNALEQTKNLLYLGDISDGWKLYGKAGSGLEENHSLGWFVGWFTNEKIHKTYIFACLLTSHDGNVIVRGADARQKTINILSQYYINRKNLQ